MLNLMVAVRWDVLILSYTFKSTAIPWSNDCAWKITWHGSDWMPRCLTAWLPACLIACLHACLCACLCAYLRACLCAYLLACPRISTVSLSSLIKLSKTPPLKQSAIPLEHPLSLLSTPSLATPPEHPFWLPSFEHPSWAPLLGHPLLSSPSCAPPLSIIWGTRIKAA